MKRFSFACLFLIAGCANKPCDTTSECGSGETCAAAHCQALSCSAIYFAVDPSDGSCRPLPGCGNRDDVRGWATCDDPCTALGENACISDRRCQPAYRTDDAGVCNFNGAQVPAFPGGGPAGGCSGPRNFDGCHANPLRVDPCAGLDSAACATDSRCVNQDFGCLCAQDSLDCNCGPACRLKTCGDYLNAEDCAQDPECSSDPNAFPPQPDDSFGPRDQPFFGCFQKGLGSCFQMDESTCRRHAECHPVADPHGKFAFCEADDGLTRCNSDSECGTDQRCNNDETCAPPIGSIGGGVLFASDTPHTTTASNPASCPGLCVPKGCSGHAESGCVTDPACEPVYVLNCSPYGGGGFEDGFVGGCGFATTPPQGPNEGAPQTELTSCPPCEPSFVQCLDRAPGVEVDPDSSVLNRDPAILDTPLFSFANVMKGLAGAQDPAVFVDRWLGQIGADVTVNGKVAVNRPAAAAYLQKLPRLADGRLDLEHLGFQATSLSNRIDLAGAGNCGEARITYALEGGVIDRRHRMTVIVELRQPDDGTRCAATARQWINLTGLKGSAMLVGLAQIYGPLFNPEHLNQLRTNEFLVGDQSPSEIQTPWELREWRLGQDGSLQLAPSKQALDPNATSDAKFQSWLQENSDAVKAQSAIVPDAFLAVTSSENGSRITLQNTLNPDFQAEAALNKMACAGCHTTETNSAFAHVGERFNGTGRAKISDFLRKELPSRTKNLWLVGQGRLDLQKRQAIKPVH